MSIIGLTSGRHMRNIHSKYKKRKDKMKIIKEKKRLWPCALN
jgi:hypothetical protein